MYVRPKKMSLNAYHRSLLSTNLNFKRFVSESSVSRVSEKFSEKRRLNFRGDEARVAYEEIVGGGDSFVDRTKGLRIREDKRPKLSRSRREKSATRDRPGESRKRIARVTANCVLKAVESGDVDYLERNVTTSNVNISDDYGWTPLMSAAFCGNYKIVDFLLKLGANTRCRDKSGFTAGGLASKKNYSGIVALLKEKESLGSEVGSSAASSPRKERSTERKEFYCSVCRETFRETSLKRHENSTLHIFNTRPKLPGTVYSIPKLNKGYQMLLKGGWNEEGLGPDGRGTRYPVKTVLKRDRAGLDETRSDKARVTHFRAGDSGAVSGNRRPREKTLRRRDRERLLGKEARRERAIRRALS